MSQVPDQGLSGNGDAELGGSKLRTSQEPGSRAPTSLRAVMFDALVQHEGREKRFGLDLADALLDAIPSGWMKTDDGWIKFGPGVS